MRRIERAITAILLVVLLAPSPARTAPASVSKHVLPNGLTLLVKENPTVDLMAVEILIRAGPRVEEDHQSGITFFVQQMLPRGTQHRSGTEIALTLESIGGILQVPTSVDYAAVSAVTPARHVDTALDVLADVLTNARFDPADIETQRRVSLARIRVQADRPSARTIELLASSLYGLHPYGKPILGTAETVRALTREQLLDFYRTFYVASNMVVVVAGNITPDAVLAKVRRAFSGLQTGAVPRRVRLLPIVEQALAPRPAAPQEVREVRQITAAWAALGYLGASARHRDYAPLRVLDGILRARLYLEIREKQGLAYEVGSSYTTRLGPGMIVLFAGSDSKNLRQVIDGMLREVERLRTAPPREDDLEPARRRIIGTHSIEHENLQSQAFFLGWYELLGVGYHFDERFAEEISRVTATDVHRVARRYLATHTVAVLLPPGE